jgi:hypothetical protein
VSDQFKKDIETHIEMLVDDDMRSYAFASTDHDTAFQIFRLLSGYRLALTQLTECKAQIEAMRCCGNCEYGRDSYPGKWREGDHLCYECKRNKVEENGVPINSGDRWQPKGGK